jgi:hypothetical protein
MKPPLSFTIIYNQIATGSIILNSSSPHPETPMDSTPSASLPRSGGDGDMDEGGAPEAVGTRAHVDELIVHNSNIYHNS